MAGAFAQSRSIGSLTVPLEVEYDSNPNMSVGSSTGVTFVRAVPTVTARYVRDVDEFGLDAALTAEKSSNQDVAKDRLDPRFRGFWKHATPLTNTELAVVLDRSALRDLGLSNQVQTGTDGSRTLYGFNGRWTRDLDPLSALSVEGSQEWEKYSGTPTADFRRTTGVVRYSRARSERQTWYAAVNGQLYRSEESTAAVPPTPSQRSTVIGALAGVDHEFSPWFRLDAGAGPVHFIDPVSRNGWQAVVRATYTAERWSGGLDFSRTPVVNATFGGLVLSDQLRLRFRYDLGALSHVAVEGGHARESVARSSRTEMTAAWVRQWTESWQVSIKASRNRQQGPEGTARSNRIGVVLIYTAPDL